MASSKWTRRQLLKTSALSAAGGALVGRFTGVLGASGLSDEALGSTAGQTMARRAVAGGRERLLADFGWKFSLGHANDPSKDFGFGRGGIFAKAGSLIGGGRNGIASPNFNDSAWTSVDLPHDWAIDLPFVNDRALDGHGYKPLGRTYPESSIGWYRRTFDTPATDAARRTSIVFDGVYRDAMVVLNGHYLGRNLSGYTPVRYDVTDFLNYGGTNVLIVRVDATENEGWFYEGAGIYRHVWVEKTDPLHIAPDGVFVQSRVNAGGSATVTVQVEITNAQNTAVTTSVSAQIHSAQGITSPFTSAAVSAPVSLKAWESKTVTQAITVAGAALWHPDTPALYRATIRVGTRDAVDATFGIRTLKFDAAKGFFLNGKPLKIQGMCNHQDHAGVGAALPDSIQEFRIKKLKEMGTNAYRSSHNPPTPELLDACDRLGMLVMSETRMMDASDEGLLQLERLVKRDRNHPSVFLWSIGNEEPEQNTDRGARIGDTMIRLVRRLDPTRPITEANNGSAGWGKGLGPALDVFGFNYSLGKTDEFHAAFPKQPTIGTEWASTVSTRGIYENDLTKGYVSAYDRNFPPWASTAETWWTHADARPWIAGGFVWTGFDYRGEPTPYQWPCINSHFGILDMCGFPKDLFYYYKAWWGPSSESVLHLFPHWNWPGQEGQEVEVWSFTNCQTVELFVNGLSQGWQAVEKNGHAAWKVRYQPGVIEVRGRHPNRAGLLVARRETTGAPAKLFLRADRTTLTANGEDTAVIACEVQDAEGRVVPIASDLVQFSVTGDAKVIGVGNGDPSSHEADRADKRSAFNGLCMALVQATKKPGAVTVEATAPGLSAASIALTSNGSARQSL
jgi:beta-galactosidase